MTTAVKRSPPFVITHQCSKSVACNTFLNKLKAHYDSLGVTFYVETALRVLQEKNCFNNTIRDKNLKLTKTRQLNIEREVILVKTGVVKEKPKPQQSQERAVSPKIASAVTGPYYDYLSSTDDDSEEPVDDISCNHTFFPLATIACLFYLALTAMPRQNNTQN